MAIRILAVLVALAVCFWAGIQYERSRNAADVLEAQKLAAERQREIDRLASLANTNALKAQEAERERQRAIDTTTEGLQRAKERLAACISGSEKNRAGEKKKGSRKNGRGSLDGFSLFSPASFERVWNESRKAGLPEVPDSASTGQAVLPTPEDGDGVNKAVKLCVTKYNSCAMGYNSLLNLMRTSYGYRYRH